MFVRLVGLAFLGFFWAWSSEELPQSQSCFDFGDGQGCVAAHQHVNGGGWVSEYAHVVPGAYVGADSFVYGNAQVYKGAIVANGRISGGLLRGAVIITGGGQISGGVLEAVAYDSDKIIVDGGVVSGGHLIGSVQIKNQA